MRISRHPPTSSQGPLVRGGDLTQNQGTSLDGRRRTPHLALPLLIGGLFSRVRAWCNNSSLQLCPSCDGAHPRICFLLRFTSQPAEQKRARTGRSLGEPVANVMRLECLNTHPVEILPNRREKLELIACIWGLIKIFFFSLPDNSRRDWSK